MTEYKYRHRETYRGEKLDIRAHTSGELQEKVKRKKRQIDLGSVDEKIRFMEFGQMYLEAHKLNTVSDSWYKDLNIMLRVIVREIGNRPLSRIRPIDLQEYLNSLTGFSDSYIKKQYDLICQIFYHAYINGATPADYTLHLVRPHGVPTGSGRSITDQERKILLQVLEGHRGELFCKLILYCGLRPSECQALKWSDIDLDKRTVTVSKSMKRSGQIGPPKTNAAYRSVPVPEHLIPLLEENRQPPDSWLFKHDLHWRRRMWLNVQRKMNLAMGVQMYRNKLLEPLPLAPDFDLYNLRHTYCTDLEKLGVPINIASRLMGHSSINITAKIYTHASTEALEIARNLIDSGGLRGQ